jgi:hypothetical protein
VIEQESKGSFSRFLAYLDLLPLDESQKVQIGSLVMTYKNTFAAAQVSAKDAQIAELTRKLQIQDTMHANTEAVLTEEIKRLREGIRKALKYIEGPHHSNPEPIAIYEILQHIISPSDGDGETKAAPVVDETITIIKAKAMNFLHKYYRYDTAHEVLESWALKPMENAERGIEG